MTSVTGDLITGYMTSGANLTGMLLRLLYGTREVTIDLLTKGGTQAYKDDMRWW